MPKILIMYSLAVIGGAFFVTKFPESYFPGINFVDDITLLILVRIQYIMYVTHTHTHTHTHE